MARFVSPNRVSSAPVNLQTDFYREEFLKHRECLARQREYYSERAITDADGAIARILNQLEQLCAKDDADGCGLSSDAPSPEPQRDSETL